MGINRLYLGIKKRFVSINKEGIRQHHCSFADSGHDSHAGGARE